MAYDSLHNSSPRLTEIPLDLSPRNGSQACIHRDCLHCTGLIHCETPEGIVYLGLPTGRYSSTSCSIIPTIPWSIVLNGLEVRKNRTEYLYQNKDQNKVADSHEDVSFWRTSSHARNYNDDGRGQRRQIFELV